jgi:hypothetical protein
MVAGLLLLTYSKGLEMIQLELWKESYGEGGFQNFAAKRKNASGS